MHVFNLTNTDEEPTVYQTPLQGMDLELGKKRSYHTQVILMKGRGANGPLGWHKLFVEGELHSHGSGLKECS